MIINTILFILFFEKGIGCFVILPKTRHNTNWIFVSGFGYFVQRQVVEIVYP
ncbi:hypothetical protein THERMOT_338 [Bathymodiolus thermophilus thioautotrophic gill symbiont]|uniref:Uncharacterized protein n=1 Tax=Bathymodiolus thermophilus thioautotrophic gill symbiont TaxID=2360 RepID=A0A8H8XCI7_9GAMM|nr:hypothetical protein THERMOT_338 [Bathymodiolus thermophilus thioautotrophic gill symbiont]CAB5497086.1 hypothetical protein THERMOS_622 [Bathymodiolus thermophilus thioautotrophic gill symbiont]